MAQITSRDGWTERCVRRAARERWPMRALRIFWDRGRWIVSLLPDGGEDLERWYVATGTLSDVGFVSVPGRKPGEVTP